MGFFGVRSVLFLGLASLFVFTLLTPVTLGKLITVGNRFEGTEALLVTEPWHAYEMDVPEEAALSYSIEALNGSCVNVLLVRGHNVTPESRYYVDYSTTRCAPYIFRVFQPRTLEGSDYTLFVTSNATSTVSYSLLIEVNRPAPTPLWVYPVLGGIGGIVLVTAILLHRRRKERAG